MQEYFLEKFDLEELLNHPAAERLKKGYEILCAVQERAYRLAIGEDSGELAAIRACTVFVFAVLEKISKGKKPKAFDKQDWEDIGNLLAQYVVFMEEQQYCVLVFRMYAEYIEATLRIFEAMGCPQASMDSIHRVAEQLRFGEEQLAGGAISESEYIEESLWLSLEGIFKILAAYGRMKLGDQYGELAEAAALMAFEYGRLKLHEKELELLKEFLNHQQELDEELRRKHEEFLEELKAEAQVFDNLLETAFDTDFTAQLRGSVQLAQAMGVKKELILDSNEAIDAFFLN